MKTQETDWLFIFFVLVTLAALLFAVAKIVDSLLYERKLRKRRMGQNDIEIRSQASKVKWMNAKS
ncbi:hypothetical protein [Adhaeribacter aquaticus]|uniref:hypothetical protein n=1 Tax=Adhaeribacter aquaticus TaxID=299567 RepID=UPI0003F7BC81|nr:hypothetical protein [Adhaeribacter aquaticus]